MIRVLQTLAFPLGHDAMLINRAGDGTRTHDLLLGKEMFYQLNHARRSDHRIRVRSAESQDRTDDTAIFSRVLYQLSYLGLFIQFSRMRANFTRCMLIVKHALGYLAFIIP